MKENQISRMHTREGRQTGFKGGRGALGFFFSSNIDLWQSRNTFLVLSSIINKHVIPLNPLQHRAWHGSLSFLFTFFIVEIIACIKLRLGGQYLLASRCNQINKQAD